MKKKDYIETTLNYRFRDRKLLQEALIAAGAGLRSRANARKHGNKGLALIGDAILRLVLVDDGILTGKSTGKLAGNRHIDLYVRTLINSQKNVIEFVRRKLQMLISSLWNKKSTSTSSSSFPA